jgi:hypothetical protein
MRHRLAAAAGDTVHTTLIACDVETTQQYDKNQHEKKIKKIISFFFRPEMNGLFFLSGRIKK